MPTPVVRAMRLEGFRSVVDVFVGICSHLTFLYFAGAFLARKSVSSSLAPSPTNFIFTTRFNLRCRRKSAHRLTDRSHTKQRE